jgi:hypothetical protein
MLTSRAIPNFPPGRPVRLTVILLLSVTTAALAGAAEPDASRPDSPTVTLMRAPAAVASGPAVTAGLRPPAVPPSHRPGERHDVRRRPPRATGAGVVVELRSDFGFERVAHIEFSNDRRASMDLNDGLGLSAGLSFLPLANGRLATRVTAGIKIARLRASNGAALFTAFPLELMEAAYVGPLRLGAGLSVLFAPRIRADGLFEPLSTTYGPAPGAVADAEWILSPRTRTGIGIRASWNRFAAGGSASGAPAIGLVVRSDFDVVGR